MTSDVIKVKQNRENKFVKLSQAEFFWNTTLEYRVDIESSFQGNDREQKFCTQ